MKHILVLIICVCSLFSIKTLGATLTQNDMDNRVKVELNTSLGRVVVELYNETPKHRDNFVKLVDSCFYDGVLFHRVIKDFMVQTGDPDSKTADSEAHLGSGDPGYTIEAEIVYPQFFHKRGALAAARTPDQFNPQRRSSGSQFYIVTGAVYNNDQMGAFEMRLQNQAKQAIFGRLVEQNRQLIESLYAANDTVALQNMEQEFIAKTEAEYALSPVSFTQEQRDVYTTLGGTPHLDGQYTVFGEVIEGYDVVDKIQQVATKPDDRPVEDVKILSAKVLR